MLAAQPGRDADYLNRLRDYYSENLRIPSLQRIAQLMGFASKAAASKLLARLHDARYLERTAEDDAWIPAERFFERPLADIAVRAGVPEDVDSLAPQPFLVDRYLVRKPSETVMIPVKGDSMIDAGIREGDIAVVVRTHAARAGDFVVAIVDNEFTLKELATERGKYILRPHNRAYPVIRPKGELEVFGVVTGLIRKYRD
jgi:SOS-response transcriptional repressor LexA